MPNNRQNQQRNRQKRRPKRRNGVVQSGSQGSDSNYRSQVDNIPRVVVPDKLVLISTEPANNISVSATTGAVKWLAFANGGWYFQDGSGNPINSNSWISDYWGVVEKAGDYHAYARIVSLRVQLITPGLHVAGNLAAYKHAQCALVPANQRDTAFGSDLSGFTSCKLIPSGQGYTITVYPSQEAKKHTVPSIIDSQALKTVANANYQFQSYPMFRLDPVAGTSVQGDLLGTFYVTITVELSGRLGSL